MNKEQIQKRSQDLQTLLEFLKDCAGSSITIQQSLSLHGSFDRHSTLYTHFTMTLGHVGFRFSGGMIMLDGIDENDGTRKTQDGKLPYCPQATYELSAMNIKEIPVPDHRIIINEYYPGTIVRQTAITGLVRKHFD